MYSSLNFVMRFRSFQSSNIHHLNYFHPSDAQGKWVVKFTKHSDLDLPSPEALVVHASIANILHWTRVQAARAPDEAGRLCTQ
jgi:hypothetical protein